MVTVFDKEEDMTKYAYEHTTVEGSPDIIALQKMSKPLISEKELFDLINSLMLKIKAGWNDDMLNAIAILAKTVEVNI